MYVNRMFNESTFASSEVPKSANEKKIIFHAVTLQQARPDYCKTMLRVSVDQGTTENGTFKSLNEMHNLIKAPKLGKMHAPT